MLYNTTNKTAQQTTQQTANQTGNQTAVAAQTLPKTTVTYQTVPPQTMVPPSGPYYAYVGSVANPAYGTSQGFQNAGYVYDQNTLLQYPAAATFTYPSTTLNSVVGYDSRSSTMVRSQGSGSPQGFKVIQQGQVVYLPQEEITYWK